VCGGIALNDTVREFDSSAVEKEAVNGGKFVWFPTMEAYNYHKFKNKNTTGKISIFENGKIKESVYNVLEIIKSYNMILSTGHISKHEALELIRAGNKMGIKKMILTHADLPPVFTTSAEQKVFVSLGAIIEHSYYTIYKNETSWEVMLEQIKTIGFDNIIISSDLGQATSPFPDEGLNEFASGLISMGIKQSSIDKMLILNPERLLS